jgi:hypothetical protein
MRRKWYNKRMPEANHQIVRKSTSVDATMNRWRFSIRSLLVLTATLSIVLAFAVNLPELFRVALVIASPVLLIVAILQAANFATSDRRPRLSVLSWILLGTFFALYSAAIFRMLFEVGGQDLDWPYIMLGLMSTCCLVCIFRACRSYMLVRRRGIVTKSATDDMPTPAQTLR